MQEVQGLKFQTLETSGLKSASLLFILFLISIYVPNPRNPNMLGKNPANEKRLSKSFTDPVKLGLF